MGLTTHHLGSGGTDSQDCTCSNCRLITFGYAIIKNSLGRKFRIEAKYLEERRDVDQKELCGSVKIPVLIVHGDGDDSVKLSESQKAMKYLPKGSQLVVVEGSGHDMEDLDAFAEAAAGWFEKHLSKPAK